MKFSLPFIREIDIKLKNIYSKRLSRERFFLLYELIERKSMEYPEVTFRNIKARLKAEYIKNYLGKYYQEYIDISISHNIICSDNHYIVGKKSKDYWLNINLVNKIKLEELIMQEEILIEDEKLFNKIKEIRKKDIDKKHWKLISFLNRIEFDETSAIQWLMNLVKNGFFINKDGIDNTRKFNVYQRMINDMIDKNWVCVQDEKTGRIFHTFNLIKRELRNFCYVDGQKLVSSDLKSSQPYFLASRLIKMYPYNENIISFFNDITENDIYSLILDRYIQINGSNEYKEIILHKDKPFEWITKEFKDRNDIKPQFLKVLYKDNKGYASLVSVFKQYYPEVFKVITELKKTAKEELPLLLQTDEAKVFITTFNNIKEEIWCLPVHDSLYVKEQDKQYMLDMLNYNFNKLYFNKYKLN